MYVLTAECHSLIIIFITNPVWKEKDSSRLTVSIKFSHSIMNAKNEYL